MIITILAILIILWFLGYTPIGGINIPNVTLISINNHAITLWNVLILLAILWGISILPRPFREIASVLLLLWVLSVIGILAIAGLSNILVIAIIVGFAIYIFQGALTKNNN
jgi:hypothetical protein